MQKTSFLFAIFLLFSSALTAQNTRKSIWVDSVYNKLTINERFGQLLMIRANQSNQPYKPEIDQYINEYGIGGVCFFASDPHKQIVQMNNWQEKSRVPMMISIDAEWGLGMRLDSTISYPFQMTLGSIENDSLIYLMGKQIGNECKRMGIHLNFAPVVDVNNNPKNPVINSRSFGDDPIRVSNKAVMYMAGLQESGILATAKHFPGHGDTETDSHKTLPIVSHSKKRLNDVELLPYKKLIDNGLTGVMIAHLYVPEYEKEKNLATTLSPKVVTGLLQNDLGFQGLIVTDALDMKGVTKYFPSGEIEVKAMLAGNDILLLPEKIPAAINGLRYAFETGRISKELLEAKCKKILGYKYNLGLHEYQPTKIENLIPDLNSTKGKALREKLYENSITLIQNKDSLLPLSKQKKNKLAVINYGLKAGSSFEKYASKYTDASYFYLPKKLTTTQNDSIYQLISEYSTILFNIGGTTIFPQRSFGITSSEIYLINKTAPNKQTIINLLGSPLAVQKFFPDPKKYTSFIISHQNNNTTQKLSAEMIFGALGFRGKLPVKISDELPAGFGLETDALGILRYGFSESEGIDGTYLMKEIDSIVSTGIEMEAFPGCQILIARNGSIVFNKSYGFQTYDSIHAINSNTIYDIASITKVVASVPSLMYLHDKGKLPLDSSISDFLPYLENTNKSDLSFRNILTHQSQLTAWIPFYWYNTDSSGNLNPNVFRYHQDDVFSTRVADGLYIDSDYKYEMYDTIIKSDLRKKKEYKYSDLGYYFVPEIIHRHYNLPFDEFVNKHFYSPLNLKNTSYKPRRNYPLMNIAPTEYDTLFRKQVIRGDVHDPGAAMLGGVCGHAGVFSNTVDLAAIFQLYLQQGYYGGNQYFDSATIHEFTRYQFDGKENRRALGFDKAYKEYDKYGPVCESANTESFGHSGFTGTYAWADPVNQTVYIFLSNRVYPRSDNYKISKFNFRTNIQQVIYNAIERFENNNSYSLDNHYLLP